MNALMQLGEAGVPHDDTSYDGADTTDMLSMDYYREKAREFQDVLNSVDAMAQQAMDAVNAGISDELTTDLLQMLNEYDSQKWTMRATAETINAGAYVINAAGGRFPVLSIPSGLGFLPALPVAAVAAIGVAATLIAWGVTWIDGVNERLKIETYSAVMNDPATDPAVKQQLASIIGESERIKAQSSQSGLASIANIVKWGAIGVGAWMAYKAFTEYRRN